jgi:FtsP/CotA-like multicopper oxidase with cupredoxin domain
MKKLILMFALAGCESAPPAEPPHACTSPADDVAAADVTITAKDATLDLGDGKTFEAWTFDGDVPGPVLHMNVGDSRRVKLVNRSPRAASLHFHGVTYSASDDGTPEHEESVVYPNCAHVYTIKAEVPGAWPYHSHVDSRQEMAQGQYGAVIVSAANETPADPEYVAFLGQLGLEDASKEEGAAPFFMTINGRPNGHATVIQREGDRYVASAGVAHAALGAHVRWRVLDVSPDDPHTFHVHGHRWCDRGGLADALGVCPNGGLYTDDPPLLPAEGITVDWIESEPGDWMFHCHILDHVGDGMWAMFHAH